MGQSNRQKAKLFCSLCHFIADSEAFPSDHAVTVTEGKYRLQSFLISTVLKMVIKPYSSYINLYAKNGNIIYLFSVSRKSNLCVLLPYSSHKCEDSNLFLYRGPDYLVKQFAPDL